MKKLLLITLIFISGLCMAQTTTNEIDTYYATKVVVMNNKAANGTACTATVIDECGTTFNTSNYGEANTGNGKGWKSGGQDWYNDLDNNATTGTFNSASYPGISGGLGDVAYSVENDIFYKFCPTSLGAWDITINPSNCISSLGGVTTNGFQYAVFEGPDCGNFGNGLLAGGVNGQNHTTSQTTTINVTNLSNCIFIQIDGYAGTQCDFAVSVTRTIPCVLPIELEEFDGFNKGDINNIYWVTATEINNDQFILERSRDSKDWNSIYTVSGAGNSNTPILYEFKDDDASKGTNYYRLTQVDFNGDTETFKTISITTPIVEYQDFDVYDMSGRKETKEYNATRIILWDSGKRQLVLTGQPNPKQPK